MIVQWHIRVLILLFPLRGALYEPAMLVVDRTAWLMLGHYSLLGNEANPGSPLSECSVDKMDNG